MVLLEEFITRPSSKYPMVLLEEFITLPFSIYPTVLLDEFINLCADIETDNVKNTQTKKNLLMIFM